MGERKVMERDPVWGMQVDAASAGATSEHGGRLYFYCCRGWARKFETAPEQYLKPQPAPSGPMQTMISPAPAAAPVQKPLPSQPPVRPSLRSFDRAFDKASATVPSTPKSTAVEYICPMDPEVHQNKPGACPKCGMALEPAVPAIPSAKTEYVCPMHPEIGRAEPGSCPIS